MIHPSTQVASSVQTSVALALVLAFWLPTFDVSTGLAQESTAITPTTGVGSLGTTVTADGNTVQITGGTRPGDGTNLFHSFDQFSVGRPDTAQFLNTTPSFHTSTILGRVTGGNPSSIFGAIDTMSYPGANLFLMNPAGIVFGPTATLHVGGLVAFTTANYLRLAEADGSNAGIFHAETTSTSLLTSASVVAFGFLGTNPSAISVQGSMLHVQPGQSISLVGGNQGFKYTNTDAGTVTSVSGGVTMTAGTLTAQSGEILMANAASPGEFLAGTLDQAPNINGQSFGALGTIQVSRQSSIDVSGNRGGTILIRGGRLVVDDSTISANIVGPDAGLEAGPSETGIDIEVAHDVAIDNGSIIETNVIGPVAQDRGSGGVRITADHIEISGGPKIFAMLETDPETIPFAGIRSNVKPESTGARSGDISLDATSIRIKDVGQIETRTANTGNAGHITLKASGNIDMDFAIVSSVSENSSGHAGNITFSSSQGNVSLTNTGVTSQTINSSGNAGNIAILAPQGDIVLADFSGVFNTAGGTGKLGGIQITANNLELLGESRIEGDNLTTPIAGNISIVLENRLSLSGGSAIETGALGSADAADLIIRVPDILIAEQSMLLTDTINSGAAGQLSVFTDNLQLADGGTLSSKSFIGSAGEIPSGSGGVISIQGLRSPGTSVVIDGPGSGIFTNTEGIGAGGNIVVNADSVTLTNGATVSASSTGQIETPGDAGNIDITATNGFTMQNSTVTTAAGQKASGGNIKVTTAPSATVLLENSQISASVSDGPGGGGNISIDPQYVILQNSQILAQAADGQGGAITITTNLFLPDATSIVNADANPGSGVNGTVTIQSPNAPASGKVQPLGNTPLQATSLLNQHCAALAGGEFSSFTVAGRDILPAEPGSWLASPLATLSTGKELGLNGEGKRFVARGEGLEGMTTHASLAGERTLLSLRQIAPAGFLTQAFAVDWSASCQS